MKLINLKLENFQGIKSAEYQLDGHSASIYGDNATGKTTIFNAVTWLLFDRASTGAKNFTPKTKGPEGDLHYLDHAAEATFDINGRSVTLRKVYHENYKKKRGSATEEFDGHGVDYFVDGVPTKEKDFQLTLLAFCGSAEKMKMLTMPDYFPEELAWDARRKILLETCGDVDDDAVIASNPELAELPDYLKMPGSGNQRYSVEDYKKIAQATKTDINKQIQGIPGRIDEAERAIPDTTGIDPEQIDREVEGINTQRAELEQKKAMLLTGDSATAEIRQRISAEQTKLAELRAAYAERNSTANSGILTQINDLKTSSIGDTNAARDARNDSERKQREVKRMRELREQLLKDYTAVQSERWDEGAETCPTCGQRLPEDSIQKHREEFNLRKSKRLEDINRRGTTEASKDMIADADAAITALDAKAAAHEAAAADTEKKIESLRAQIVSPQPFEQTEEYRSVSAQIEAYRAEEREVGNSTSTAANALTGEIQALFTKAEELKDRKASLRIAASQKERIEELKRSEKTLGERYEELEHGVYLCELFTKTKVSLLTERINEKFKSVRFRLFVEQINGGVKEDCEVMIPAEGGKLVPFAFANNAARINAGLEIINTLSHHWGIEMPVFIDNAESVTRILQMDTQVIRLVVSEPDKTLRMELGI
jgi:DNA repair exonuclease SbcCD ATPase subunit